jgi:2,3,4,5-tetrahydropyridine-2-carboxylate N-succinyltransferase
MPLREKIEALASREDNQFSREDRATFDELKRALNRGEVRAAERDANGKWIVNAWVKQGLLLGFRMGATVDMSVAGTFKFFDKDTYPGRPTKIEDSVRIVPGGSTIRDGECASSCSRLALIAATKRMPCMSLSARSYR